MERLGGDRVGGEDGKARRLCLDDREGDALVKAREEQEVEALHQAGHVVPQAQETDAPREAEGRSPLLDFRAQFPVAHERECGVPPLGDELREDVDEKRVVLHGREAPNVPDEHLVVTHPQLRPDRGPPLGVEGEGGELDSVPHHVDPAAVLLAEQERARRLAASPVVSGNVGQALARDLLDGVPQVPVHRVAVRVGNPHRNAGRPGRGQGERRHRVDVGVDDGIRVLGEEVPHVASVREAVLRVETRGPVDLAAQVPYLFVVRA